MICKECGAKLPPDQTVCPRCGSLQPQAVRPVQKRQKQAARSAVSQQASEQKSQKQVVYTWRDKLILAGAVGLTLCAVIWFVVVLMGTAGSSKAEASAGSATSQTASISVGRTTGMYGNCTRDQISDIVQILCQE